MEIHKLFLKWRAQRDSADKSVGRLALHGMVKTLTSWELISPEMKVFSMACNSFFNDV
jgi:hypothetical protein